MPSPFVPHQPEKRIKVEITAKEAHLIKVLRKSHFGRVVVHKMNGLLVRIESSESVLLNEKDGLDLSY